MDKEKGQISVEAQNIFPIIKKWLYSDRDIFLRELVSNGCDAVHKLTRLTSLGEAKVEPNPKYFIEVTVDKEKKTLTVADNGIGMSDTEVKRYINQVAFSSAAEFIEKYRDETEASKIIGHFGLGFYSVFMVSGKVTIDTLSWQEGAAPVRWASENGMAYEMGDGTRDKRGTAITLTLTEDAEEFLEISRIREILHKYCSFLPVPVYLIDRDQRREKIKKGEALADPKPINDTHPLWTKAPNECTEDEYKEFYHKVFTDYQDPLFWIHLNVDYPFRLQGILYFPKMRNQWDMEGQIKLYNNQVFVADNIKEVIPEFLLLLRGTLDCPDLPLNVSRSFLQNDGSVRKITAHITKKVSDRLNDLYKNGREDYEKYWGDIHPFIKYGCMRDDKFYERVKDILIYKTTADSYMGLQEYLTAHRDQHQNQVYYVTDPHQQASYIKLLKQNGMEALYLDSPIDAHFITFLEMKEDSLRFTRVDADISEGLKDKEADTGEDAGIAAKIFEKALDIKGLTVKVEALKNKEVPAVILLEEGGRRMREMMKAMGGESGMPPLMPEQETLVVNTANPLVQSVLSLDEDKDRKDDVRLICRQVYDLALLSQRPLTAEGMEAFVSRSLAVLTRAAQIEEQAGQEE